MAGHVVQANADKIFSKFSIYFRVAYGNVDGKRWRTVTLQGQLVEKGGSLTGGGRAIKGLIKTHGNHVRQEEISLERVSKEEYEQASQYYEDLRRR